MKTTIEKEYRQIIDPMNVVSYNQIFIQVFQADWNEQLKADK